MVNLVAITIWSRNFLETIHSPIQASDWIDILYVHWWDYMSSIEEVMDSLHILVQQGKVLYLGVSDTPAWVVSASHNIPWS